MLHAVIIAGGAGKRLWPKSNARTPKFLLRLKGNRSLLQETTARLKGLVSPGNIIVITNKQHMSLVRKELPGVPAQNIIGEPLSKNTAPAICLAAALVRKKDPNAVMLVMPADQVIEDILSIKDIFCFASLIAGTENSIVTIGIKPTYAATGYGYIKTGKLCERPKTKKPFDAYKVNRFIEKPSLSKAKGFLKSKEYLWNSGIFIGKADVFLSEFKAHSPAIYSIIAKINKFLGTAKQQSVLEENYKKFPEISIDYALMEKTGNARVIKADVRLRDIGSWRGLDDYLGIDSRGNTVLHDSLCIDTKGTIIIGRKAHLTAAIGLKDMVIINTDNATLVCPKERAEDVKQLVDLLKSKGMKKYL